jgi:hypothetical protein
MVRYVTETGLRGAAARGAGQMSGFPKLDCGIGVEGHCRGVNYLQEPTRDLHPL